MNIESLRSFVAFNADIGEKQTVTFGDDAKQRIVGLDGNPRKLAPAEKLELDQNTILLKSRILSAVRDAVGGDQAQIFRDVETMLFGKLSNGRFTEKNAAKPLLMRDLRKVVDTLGKAQVGNGMAPMSLKGPQVQAFIAPRIDKKLQTDPKALSARIDTVLRNMRGGDPSYGILADPTESYGSSSKYLPGVPKMFAADFSRAQSFILPGVGKVSYHGDDHALERAADDMTKAVTKGRVQHFRDLEGKDLRKVQLVMSLTTQTVLNPLLLVGPAGIFGTKSDGDAQGSLVIDNDSMVLGYEVELDDDGGITVRGHEKGPITIAMTFPDPERPNAPSGTVMFEEGASTVNATVSYHYSAEKVDRILDADWKNLDPATRENLVVADSRTFDLNLKLEG